MLHSGTSLLILVARCLLEEDQAGTGPPWKGDGSAEAQPEGHLKALWDARGTSQDTLWQRMARRTSERLLPAESPETLHPPLQA